MIRPHRERRRQTGEDAAEAGERGVDVEPALADPEASHVGRVGDAARLEHRDAALEGAVDLDVPELDHVVGGERDAVSGELGGAEEISDLHVHRERHPRRPEVFGEGEDELLESTLRRDAERHAGEAVEHGAASTAILNLLAGLIEEAVGRELDGRDVAEREHPALLERVEILPESPRDPTELAHRLLEGEEDAGLAAARTVEQELEAEERLAGPRSTEDHGRASAREAAAQHVVETGRARRDALVGDFDLRPLGAAHPGKDRQAVAGDLEEMASGHRVAAAELDDLDLTDRPELLPSIGQADDAVGDRELREGQDLLRGVLPDEQAHRTPRRGVDGEVIDERSNGRRVAEEIFQSFEAVDDDDGGLFAFDPTDDLVEGFFGPTAANHRPEVGEDHPIVRELTAFVEEGELLHVRHHLHRRFGQRRQVKTLPSQSRVMEEHLEGEDGFARARLARDHVDGAEREAAAEDPIEGRIAGGEPFDVRTDVAQLASSIGHTRPDARSSGMRSSWRITTVPVRSTSTRPISTTSSRSAGGAAVCSRDHEGGIV